MIAGEVIMAESDLISRQAAIDAINRKYRMRKDSVIATINRLPAADARENVRGEWIEDKKAEQEHQLIFHKVWTCSQCGERQCRPKGSNFCPNCGADMRGES